MSFGANLWLAKDGSVLSDVREWDRLKRDLNYSVVGSTDVERYWVSTVWLGLNHQFGDGPPLIFETMVFAKENGQVNYSDLFCDRYATEQEATIGHDRVVTLLREGKKPEEIEP